MHEQNNTYFFVANLNVVYKPECSIIKEVRDQVLYLKCHVEAFPPNVTYYWYHNTQLISCKYESSNSNTKQARATSESSLKRESLDNILNETLAGGMVTKLH